MVIGSKGVLRGVAAAGLLAVVAGCAASVVPTAGGEAAPPASSSAAAADPVLAEQDPQGGTGVSKMLVFVVENRTLQRMLAHMTFVRGLATTYGYADHYYAIR